MGSFPVRVGGHHRPASRPALVQRISAVQEGAAPVFSAVAEEAPFDVSQAATTGQIGGVRKLAQCRAPGKFARHGLDNQSDSAVTGTAKGTPTRLFDIDEACAVSGGNLGFPPIPNADNEPGHYAVTLGSHLDRSPGTARPCRFLGPCQP